jgi:hypothetical protein
MGEFIFDQEGMDIAKQALTDIDKLMKEARNKLMSVKMSVDAEDVWTGDSQKAMYGFMDLLCQYQQDIVDKDLMTDTKNIIDDMEDSISDAKSWEMWRRINEI